MKIDIFCTERQNFCCRKSWGKIIIPTIYNMTSLMAGHLIYFELSCRKFYLSIWIWINEQHVNLSKILILVVQDLTHLLKSSCLNLKNKECGIYDRKTQSTSFMDLASLDMLGAWGVTIYLYNGYITVFFDKPDTPVQYLAYWYFPIWKIFGRV